MLPYRAHIERGRWGAHGMITCWALTLIDLMRSSSALASNTSKLLEPLRVRIVRSFSFGSGWRAKWRGPLRVRIVRSFNFGWFINGGGKIQGWLCEVN